MISSSIYLYFAFNSLRNFIASSNVFSFEPYFETENGTDLEEFIEQKLYR